jgi:hypothetical protein
MERTPDPELVKHERAKTHLFRRETRQTLNNVVRTIALGSGMLATRKPMSPYS